MHTIYVRVVFERILVFCSLMVALSSCAKFPQSGNQRTEVSTASSILTSTVPRSTPTIFHPTNTPLPPRSAQSEAQTTENNLVSCINKTNIPHLTTSPKLTGTLLFNVAGQVVALDGSTITQHVLVKYGQFGDIGGDSFGLSQNGSWLGFTSTGSLLNGPLSVTALSADGKRVVQTPDLLLPVFDKNSFGWNGYGWIGDQLVIIGFFNSDDPTEVGVNGMLNPFTGDWRQTLVDNLPDKLMYPKFSGVAFSPDLTRALYVRESPPNSSIGYLVLWDNTNHRELWRMKLYTIPDPQVIGLRPSTWTANSSSIAIIANDETGNSVYILDREGISAIPIPNLSLDDRFFGAAWSPDNRYLAFYANKPLPPSSDGPYKDDIVVYDRVTQSTFVLCSFDDLADDNLTAHIIDNKLIWSPDGQYLVYGMGSVTGETLLAVENIFTGEIRAFKPGSRAYNLIGWSPIAPWIAP